MARPTSEGRPRAWDLLTVYGIPTDVAIQFPTGTTLPSGASVWIGGTADDDFADLTGATEVPLSVVANVAQGTVPGQFEQARLRVTKGASVFLLGELIVLGEGSESVPSSQTIDIPDGTTVVIEVGSLPGTSIAIDDDGYLVAIVPQGDLDLDDDGLVVFTY